MPGVRGWMVRTWAGADIANPKSRMIAAKTINSIDRFIDLDLLIAWIFALRPLIP
jgi:hypothetical protein